MQMVLFITAAAKGKEAWRVGARVERQQASKPAI